MFCLLSKGLAAKAFLIDFAQAILTCFKQLQDQQSGVLLNFWKHAVSEPLRESIRRISDVMICILHVFCGKMPEGYEPSSDMSVMKFTKYKGNLVLELAMRTTLLEEGSWLANEVNEMIRTGATARMCEDKFQELTQLLQQQWLYPSAKTIRQCSELYDHVKKALRPAMTVDVTREFAEKLLQATK